MKKEKYEETLETIEGVTVSLENRLLTVKGEKGEVSRQFLDPKITIEVKDNNISLSVLKASKREVKIVRTYIAHMKNLMNGVKNGVMYKLKICSGHFPMNVAISGDTFSVKNFLGEKVPRVLKLKQGVKVKIDGDIVLVEGVNKELCGQEAARIEHLTVITNRDKRIFQDGIYLIEKNGKQL